MKSDEKTNHVIKVQKYLKYWRWIVFSLVLSMFLAFAYQRYVTKIYKATSTILINDYRRAGFNSEISAFTDKFSVYNQNRVSIDNEMEFIKSRENVQEVIKSLDLNINYYSDGNVKSEDLYTKSPIKLVINESVVDAAELEGFFVFEIEKIDNSRFRLINEEKKEIGKFRYGQNLKVDNLEFAIIKNGNFETTKLSNVFVRIEPVKYSVESFRNRITTLNPGEETSVCEITFIDSSPERAIDFVNALVVAYENSTIIEKKKQIKKTYDFVKERLVDVDDVLSNTESSDESYKRSNDIVDVDIESDLTLSKKEEFSNKMNENSTIIALVQDVIKEIYNDNLNYMPSNIVPVNQILMGQMIKYNEDITDFNKFSIGTSKNHPDYIEKRQKLLAQKKSIIDGLTNFVRKLEQENAYYGSKYNIVLNKIGRLPNQEKEVTRSQRKIGIISETYKYLMNKKEETAISLYSVSPNSKVIEKAFCTYVPIYPSKKIVYLIAFFLGLFLPVAIIYGLLLFDTKINSKHDVTSRLSLPYLGDISFSKNKTIGKNSRDSVSESFRIVRANLDYVLKTLPVKATQGKCYKIFITSTIPKEGKTFVGVNLALSFSQINKKVLLIGMDIRNPKFEEYLPNINANVGLTNYLYKENDEIEKYIQRDEHNNIDILTSGTIPPNPTELLLNEKIEKLFSSLEEKYDIIIVDTAPVSLVSDTILISKFADAFIYVLRNNYSEKRFLENIAELEAENKLTNISVLVNDVPVNKGYNYGYGYGYGYGEFMAKKPFMKKIKKLFKTK